MRRLKGVLAGTALLLLLAAPALAAPVGPSLSWDRCFGDGGGRNKAFACDTNTGSERLVVSFVPDTALATVIGASFHVLLQAHDAVMPSWWEFRNPGSCRTNSLSTLNVLPPGSSACVDWGAGLAAGNVGAYKEIFANAREIAAAFAVPSNAAATLEPGQEYYFASLTINHAKTVGAGACGGCTSPVCLLIEDVQIEGLLLPFTRYYAGTNGPLANQLVTWQDGLVTDYTSSCAPHPATGVPVCGFSYACTLSGPTGSRGSTWGAVKAIYR